MKIPQLKATFAFVMSVILLLFSCSLFAQGSTDTTLEKLRYQLSPELQKRLSGVKYGIINATKEEVDNAINQRDYQDLISNVAKYFELRLGIKYFGFTATQIKEVMSKDDVSICDIVEVGLDPGTFKRTFGAIGVYRDAALLFKFCDGKKYRVQLEDISVDGYSYHPNRFYAAFNRLKTPTIKYNIENRLEIKTLRIVSTRDRIDSIVSNNQYPFVGEFQSLGLDQISASYRIAIIPYPNGELHHCGMNKISYA
jgi:hypothetical protein